MTKEIIEKLEADANRYFNCYLDTVKGSDAETYYKARLEAVHAQIDRERELFTSDDEKRLIRTLGATAMLV